MKTVSTKLDNKLHNRFIEICNEDGKCQSEFLRNLIESVCDDLEEGEATPQDLEINVEDIEPITEDKLRIFDCNSGIMYENGIVVGNCSEFDLRQGKVFDKSGKQIGITRGLKSIMELKNPTSEIIYQTDYR